MLNHEGTLIFSGEDEVEPRDFLCLENQRLKYMAP